MTLTLDPNLGVGTEALQSALRKAAPESPAFANAVVTATTDRFVVLPGVPGQEIRFGPSSTDSATVLSMRLDPAQTRYLDGVLSGDVLGLAGTTVAGSVAMTLGANISARVHGPWQLTPAALPAVQKPRISIRGGLLTGLAAGRPHTSP